MLNSNIQSPIIPRTKKYSAHGDNNLSQEESEVPSSPEDIASSDQEIDQEPDQEVTFHLGHDKLLHTCPCHI